MRKSTLMRTMAAAGATLDAIILAIEALEDQEEKAAEARAKVAARKARQRARERDSHGTVTGQSRDMSRDTPLSERPSEPSSTTLEVNQNSPPYSPPKIEKLPTKPKRAKRAYSEAFERFWSGYPTDPNMSKPEAADEFDRLDEDDQARCISAAGPFSTYCAKNPDYRPVHAVRFIRQRRFDGFAQSHAPPPGVPTFETDEDHAKWWEQQMLSRAAQ